MLSTKTSRPLTLAALALSTALLFVPLPARADSPASAAEAAQQESLWSRFLSWLDLTAVFSESSPHIDPNGRPASTTDYSPHIDPNG
jgi:hypothetical protein